jgi:crossover junction endodeoxyribonuclease RuvC
MRIIGIDPALHTTGFGIIDWDGEHFALVAAGTITTDPRQPHLKRLERIYSCTTKLLEEYTPDAMVLEKLYAHHHHPATAYVLGQARGVICLACAGSGLPLVEYAATRVKKALTGKGLASKLQVQKMVASMLGLASLPAKYDVTDALALAIAFCHLGRKP